MTVVTTGPRNGAGERVSTCRGLTAAAGLLAIAAAVHAVLIPEHLQEWMPAGVFFAVVASGQALLALALVLRRGRSAVLLAAVWSSVATICLYVWSRTAGVPFLPTVDSHAQAEVSHAGHAVGGHGSGVPIFPDAHAASGVEPVAALDLVALGAELGVVAILVALLAGRCRRWTSNGIFACGVMMLILRGVAGLP